MFFSKVKKVFVNEIEINNVPLNNEQVIWSEIRPVDDYDFSVEEMKKSMLPIAFSNYAFEEALAINDAKPDYLAVSLVVSAASLIGGSALITPKANDKTWKLKPTLWAMIIGDPSTYKTPMLSKGLEPLRNAQKKYIDINNLKNINKQIIHNEIIEKKKAELKSLAKAAFESGDDKRGESITEELSALRTLHIAEREIIVTDATPEALIVKLKSNPLGVLLVRDEISGIFASMNKQGREQERSLLLEGFNASGSYTQERIGREKITIDCVHTNLLGGLQPKKLRPILKGRKSGHEDDGFFERFQLSVFPNQKKPTYTDIAISPENSERLNSIFMLLAQLGDREPQNFDFDEEAQKMWDSWSIDFHESLGDLSCDEQAMASKYPAMVAKLSLVFHLCIEAEKCVGNDYRPILNINPICLQMALEWLSYLKSHYKKIISISDDSNSDVSVEALIEKLPKLGGAFTKQQLGQKDWKYLTSAKDRNRALETLEEQGYIQQVTIPKKQYLVHPDFC